MDDAVQTQPEEPGAAVQPRAGDGKRWSADGEGGSSGVTDVSITHVLSLKCVASAIRLGPLDVYLISGAECKVFSVRDRWRTERLRQRTGGRH